MGGWREKEKGWKIKKRNPSRKFNKIKQSRKCNTQLTGVSEREKKEHWGESYQTNKPRKFPRTD